MKFNFKEKDLFSNKETETISTSQELEFEELSDKEATAISDGAKRKANSPNRTVITTANATNDFPLSEYYAAAGFWGG